MNANGKCITTQVWRIFCKPLGLCTRPYISIVIAQSTIIHIIHIFMNVLVLWPVVAGAVIITSKQKCIHASNTNYDRFLLIWKNAKAKRHTASNEEAEIKKQREKSNGWNKKFFLFIIYSFVYVCLLAIFGKPFGVPYEMNAVKRVRCNNAHTNHSSINDINTRIITTFSIFNNVLPPPPPPTPPSSLLLLFTLQFLSFVLNFEVQ